MEKYLEKLKKTLVTLLTVMLTVTVLQINTNPVKAEVGDDFEIYINGTTAKGTRNVNYGDDLTFTLNGHTTGESVNFSYQTRDAFLNGDMRLPITDGQITLAQGEYYLDYEVTISQQTYGVGYDLDYKLVVGKATIAAPAGVVWDGPVAKWDTALSTTGSAVLGTAITYTVQLLKNGTPVNTYTTQNTSYDFTSIIESNGNGVYTFKVKAANGSVNYNDSDYSSESGNYTTVLVSLDPKASQFTAVTPTASFLLMPKASGKNSNTISATAKSDFTFDHWDSSESTLVFTSATSANTTVSVPDNYAGSTTATITPMAKDIVAPVITSFAASGTDKLQLKATDNTAITQVDLYYKATADGTYGIVSTLTTDLGSSITKNFTLSNPGFYYVSVKDSDNNVTDSSAIQATKINYYNSDHTGSSASEYLIGTASYSLKSVSDAGYTFKGWYDDAVFSNKITSVSHNANCVVNLYGKWEINTLNIVVNVTGTASKVYDGQNVTLTAAVSGNTGNLKYQWHKVVGSTDTEITGATANSYTVKNVNDSADYYVVVSVMNGNEVTVTSANSLSTTVAISKAPLTIKPDNLETVYLSAMPTITLSYDGFVAGETSAVLDATGASTSCEYEVGDDAGEYTISASGYTAGNYEITFQPGKLTVKAKTSNITYAFVNPSAIYTYTKDTEQKPALIVKDGTTVLTENTHYTVAYSNNINATSATSKAKAKITMKGNYSGEQTLEFEIGKATFEPTAIMTGWKYGETANDATLDSNDSSGTVNYVYRKKTTGQWSSTKPTEAGTYEVKGYVEETSNYFAVESEVGEFTISKRQITITAASKTYDYDGAAHSDASYEQSGDGFVTGQGFESVIVTGSQTAIGKSSNVITYVLTSVTNENNYTITTQNGELKVVEVTLTVPSNAKWNNIPGNVEWVAVTKKDTVISYELKLYATKDGGQNYSLVDTETTTATEWDFSDKIKEHALASATTGDAYEYSFTIKTIPTGGADKDCYYASEESDKIGAVHVGVITTVKSNHIKTFEIDGVDGGTVALIEGESVSLKANSKDGFSFYYSGFNAVNATGVSFKDYKLWAWVGSDNQYIEATLKLGSISASYASGQITASTRDAFPNIDKFEGVNLADDDYSKVRFDFILRDKGGLVAWAIDNSEDSPEADDPSWIALPEGTTNFSSSIEVNKAGVYYLHVIDTAGNSISYSDGISIYQITLLHGEGSTGDPIYLYKTENSRIPLPIGKYSRDGYAFKNWQGVATGLYEDGGEYAENRSDVLTALWTDVHFDVTVKYFYENLDGTYNDTADETEVYNLLYGTDLDNTTESVQLPRTGFSIDTSKTDSVEVIEEGLELEIYYKRNQYTITYLYTNSLTLEESEFTPVNHPVTYRYGADLSNAFTETPNVTGYEFVGWEFGELGSQPVTMPDQAFTVTGKVNPMAGEYHVRYYTQNLDPNDNTQVVDIYSIKSENSQDGLVTYQDATISINELTAPTIEGFSFYMAASSYGSESGTTIPAGASAELDAVAVASGSEDGDLYINIYYTRNTYSAKVNVWQGLVGNNLKYTHSETYYYGTPFTNEMDTLAHYEESEWEHDDEFVLAAYVDYSTGKKPTMMPAGNVVITRQFVKQISGEYQVEAWFETDVTGVYSKYTFNYYSNVMTTVTVGSGSDYTINYSIFGNSVDYFGYYQYKTVTDDEVNNGTISGTGLTGGTVTSGVVTDTNNGAEKTVLRVFFERKTLTVTITYQAVNILGQTSTIATVTKSRKWADYNSNTTNINSPGNDTNLDSFYNVEPLAFFDTTAGGNFIETSDTTMTVDIKSYKGEGADTYDFRNNNYVVSFVGSKSCAYDTRYYVKKFNTVSSLNDSCVWQMGYANNRITVKYNECNPENQYYLDTQYNPSNLNHKSSPSGNAYTTKPMIYNYGGTDYRIRICNEAYVYNSTYDPGSSFATYPGLAYYNTNAVNDPNGCCYNYVKDDSNLKDGFTRIEIAGRDYYINGNYIYIALTANNLFAGNQTSTSYETYYPGYSTVTDFLATYKADWPDDPYAQGSYIWHRGWGTGISYGNSTLTIDFHNGDVVYVYYHLNGTTCNSHLYVIGSTLNTIGCTDGTFPDVEGYHITWYTNSGMTTEAVGPIVINGTRHFYGAYAKDRVLNKEYAYYELSNYAQIGGKTYSYITENDLTVFGDDISVSSTSETIGEETVYTYTYTYNEEVVMVVKDHYNDSFSDISMDKDDYNMAGLKYDDSNSSNTLSSYVETSSVSLRAYFIRDRYALTVSDGVPNSNDTVTEYRYGQNIELTSPTRNGYVFANWNWFKADGMNFVEWTDDAPSGNTTRMPAISIKAQAAWNNDTYNTYIWHYYQNANLSYDKEAVDALISSTPSNAAITIHDFISNQDVSGTLYDNGAISFENGDNDYYFLSCAKVEGGVYYPQENELSAVRTIVEVTENDTIAVDTYASSLSSLHEYAYTIYKATGSPLELTAASEPFKVEYGMDVGYYYSLTTDFEIEINGLDIYGTSVSLPLQGSKTGCYYGEKVNVAVAVPDGYTFIGWYTSESIVGCTTLDDINDNGELVSSDLAFVHTIKDNCSFTAVVNAIEPIAPIITVSGTTALEYDYVISNQNAIIAVAEFADGTDPAVYVRSYQWYVVGSDNQLTPLENGTSNTYLIPANMDSGDYTLKCKVTAARSDNGVEKEFMSDPHILSIASTEMTINTSSYTGTYDGMYHSVTVDVQKPTSNVRIYYSETTPLDEDNYSTDGSLTNPSYKNVKLKDDGSIDSYTVYWYAHSIKPNYDDDYGTLKVTITPKVLTLSAGSSAFSKVYDGYAEVLGTYDDTTSDLGRLVAMNNGFYVVKGITAADTLANSYIIDCDAVFNSRHVDDANALTLSDISLKYTTGATDTNYKFADNYEITISGSIERKPTVLVWGTNTFTYDGTVKCPTATISTATPVPTMDEEALSLEISGQQITSGNYTAVCNMESDDDDVNVTDYVISNSTLPYAIEKRKIIITPVTSTVTYDGDYHTLTSFNVSSGGLASGHEFDCSSNASYMDAGTYTISAVDVEIKETATQADVTKNYEIICGSANLIISVKPLKLSGITVDDKNYDGNTSATFKIDDVVFDGAAAADLSNLGLDTDKITAVFENATAGENKTVTITYNGNPLTGTAAKNYSFNEDDSQSSATADIDKVEISVTAKNKQTEYGTKATLEVEYSGFVNDETVSVINGRNTITYQIGVSATNKIDYETYTDAGTYNIYADISGLSADNYTFTYVGNTLQINPKEITAQAKSGASITKTYDGTKSATVTVNHYELVGLVNNDAVTLSYTAEYDSKNVSDTNPVHMTSLSIDDDNYELTTTTFDIPGSITKKALNVKVKNASINYGDDAPTFTVDSITGFVTGESKSNLSGSVSFTTDYDKTNSSKRIVGSYYIKANGYSSNNYEISYTDGTLTVLKASLTVYPMTIKTTSDTVPVNISLADNKAVRYYGSDAIPTFTYGISGFKYSETASDITVPALVSYTHSITAENNVISCVSGDYTVKVNLTGFESDNYSFLAANGIVEVKKSGLTISGLQLADRYYDGTTTVRAADIDYSGLTYDGLAQVDIDYITSHSTERFVTATGTYASKNAADDISATMTFILGTYLTQRYYVLTSDTEVITGDIKPRPIVIKSKDASVTYGSNSDPTYDVTYSKKTGVTDSGFVSSETATKANVTITNVYSHTAGSYKQAGSYDIPVSNFSGSLTAAAGNYAPEYEQGKLTVNKTNLAAPTNVAWNAATLGKVTWSASSKIGDVDVASYEVSLYRGGTLVTGSTRTVLPTEALETNYAELIRSEGVSGVYSVKVKAIPSTTNNTDKKNVGDSTNGTSGNLVADKVTLSVASECEDSVKEGTLKVNSLTSYVMISGESGISVTATLKNATGYTIKSITCSSVMTLAANDDTTRTGDAIATTVSLNSGLTAAADQAIVITTNARPATLTLNVTPKAGEGTQAHATYGYGEADRPAITATVDVGTGDNITSSGYDYSYIWQYRLGKGSPSIDNTKVDSTEVTNTWYAPTGLSADKSLDYYSVRCVVTATRKDNGQTITMGYESWNPTMSNAVTNFNITQAPFSAVVSMDDWTYGDTRKSPTVSGVTELDKANPQLANAVFKYVAKDVYDNNNNTTEWTTDIPTDAGKYYVKAEIPEDVNYTSFTTANDQFEIKAYQLQVPNNIALTGNDKTPYGRVTYDTYSAILENAGVDSASTATPYYQISVAKKIGKKYDSNPFVTSGNGAYLDFTEYLNGPNGGNGEYRITVNTISNGDTNLIDSTDYVIETNIKMTALIKVDSEPGSETKVTKSKTFDKVGYCLSYVLYGSYSDYTIQWYRNGVAIDGYIYNNMFVTNVDESGYYAARLTLPNGTFIDTPYADITISPKDITLTSASDSKVYDGTALTNSTITDDGFCTGNNPKYKDGATYNVTGTITDVGQADNTFTYTLNSGTFACNYNITTVYGKLSVTQRPISDTTCTIGTCPDVVFAGKYFTPTPAVIDITRTPNVTLVKDTDYTLSYQNNFFDGTATVTATGIGNYSGSISTTFEIAKLQMALYGKVVSLDYNGTTQSIKGIGQIVLGNSTDPLTGWTYSDTFTASRKDVGTTETTTGTFTAKNKDNVDCTKSITPTYYSGSLTINPINEPNFTVSLAEYSVEYDGAAHYNTNTAVAASTGTALSGTTTITYSFDGINYVSDLSTLTQTNVGVYTIYVKAVNSNYTNAATSTSKLTITARKVTVYGESTIKYNGADQPTVITATQITSGTMVTGDSYTASGTVTGKNTGTYTTVTSPTFTVTNSSGNNTSNYNITVTAKLTINKATDYVPSVNASDKVYDGTAASVTSSISGGDYAAAAYQYKLKDADDSTYSSVAPVNAGSYTVKATFAETDNCVVKSATADYTISKRPVTFTGDSDTKSYTGSELSITGYKASTGTNEGLVSGHKETLSYVAKGTNASDTPYAGVITAANDTVIKNGSDDVTANYSITTTAGSLTINKTTDPMVVSLANDSYEYDGTAHATAKTASTQGTSTTLKASDVSYSYSTDGINYSYDSITDIKATDVSTVTIYVKAVNQNYVNPAYTSATLTVTKRPITVYAEKTVEYNASEQVLNSGFQITSSKGLVNSQTISVNASVKGTVVGTYETVEAGASATILEGVADKTANYDITYTGKLTISKTDDYAGTVTQADKVYDGQPVGVPVSSIDSTEYGTPTIEYKVKGESDTTYSETAPVNAGDYTIRATWAETANCLEESATDDFTINKREVTFTGKSETKKYTGSDITINTVTDNSNETDKGLVSGHTSNVVFTATGKNVDTYDGTITAKDDVVIMNGSDDVTANYSITTVAGALTIIKSDAAWTVSLDDETFVYDGKDHKISNAANNTAVGGVTTYTYSFTKNSGYVSDLSTLTKKDAGSYTVYVKAENTNYSEAVQSSAKLTITARKVKVTAEDKQKVYLEDDATLTYKIETKNGDRGLITNDELGSFKLSRKAGEDVDDYKITITKDGTTNANYDIECVNGKYTIVPLDITGGSAVLKNRLIYNGQLQKQLIKDVKAANGKTCDDYVIINNEKRDVGLYYMTITGQHNFCGSIEKPFVITNAGHVEELGAISFDLIVEEGAPSTTLNMEKGEIILSMVDAEELAAVATGTSISLLMVIKPIEEAELSENMSKYMYRMRKSYKDPIYMDISITKTTTPIDGIEDVTNVTETNTPISMTMELPENMITTRKNINRKYVMLRDHEGVELLPLTYNKRDKTVTFQSNKYSQYTLTYVDKKIEKNNPTEDHVVPNTSVK